jgi:hypothetical protein
MTIVVNPCSNFLTVLCLQRAHASLACGWNEQEVKQSWCSFLGQFVWVPDYKCGSSSRIKSTMQKNPHTYWLFLEVLEPLGENIRLQPIWRVSSSKRTQITTPITWLCMFSILKTNQRKNNLSFSSLHCNMVIKLIFSAEVDDLMSLLPFSAWLPLLCTTDSPFLLTSYTWSGGYWCFWYSFC